MNENKNKEFSKKLPAGSSGRGRRWFVPVYIALMCCFVLILLSGTKIIKSFENQTYDRRVALRNSPVFSKIQAPTHYKNPAIALVPIDGKTLKAVDEPFLFWIPYFGKVFNCLIDNGASVIAFDFQFQVSPDEYVKNQVNDIFGRLKNDKKIKIDEIVIEPYLPKNDLILFSALRKKKCVLMAYMKEDGTVEKPYEPFLYAAGLENLGLVNNEPDFDGIVRRQFLYRTEKSDEGDNNYLAFDLLTAGKISGSEIKYDEASKKIILGNKSIPHDDKFRIDINYVGPTGTFSNQYSFIDLINRAKKGDNEYFRKNFKGKAVLIGPGYTGSTDLVLTPYNSLGGLEMFGIETHANILNTIINGDYIKNPAPAYNYGILVFIGILVALMCYYLRPFQAVPASILLGIIFTGACFFALYRYNLKINMALPILAIPLNFAAVYSYRYVSEDREKRYIRKVLGRYLSENVAEEILKDPSNLALGGERTDVSILFCDINDFTTMSEITPPEEVISILNDYFARMVNVIFKYNGTLKQFVGDEIMVICGAPQQDEDHAWRICTIAVEMVEELKKWQKERSEKDQKVFDVKFGIHSGEVVAGNVGSDQRTEYTTVGDVVNTASRIMGLTKQVNSRVLISEETYDRVKGRFRIEPRGTFPVKGRQGEVRIYELIGKI